MKTALGLILAAALSAPAADPPNGKIVGNQSAPIRLEVFSDFSCPGCKAFHEQVLPVLMRDYVSQGKAFIVFRDYVLPPSPGHTHSGEAARLAVAANRVGKYRQVADALFLNQSSWAMSGKVWETVAPVLTPDEQKRVEALVKDPSVAEEVQRDTTAGNRAGLVRTPTVGINFRTQHQLWNQWGGDNALFFGYLKELLKK
ncbi:MAG TPA: thioredoxin domain-containing protein [Candidatus Acidoferrales bacterium]|nr:thioredoxin domain-containing protein [Candidatus Acidoferrales bacterium]